MPAGFVALHPPVLSAGAIVAAQEDLESNRSMLSSYAWQPLTSNTAYGNSSFVFLLVHLGKN
jgi:hypothetical protein